MGFDFDMGDDLRMNFRLVAVIAAIACAAVSISLYVDDHAATRQACEAQGYRLYSASRGICLDRATGLLHVLPKD